MTAPVVSVRPDDVSQAVLTLMKTLNLPVLLSDPLTGQQVRVSYEDVASPVGYLAVLVIAAEALWLDLTGTGFALDVRENPQALTGFSLHAIRAGSWSALMLCLIDVVESIRAGKEELCLNDLVEVWGCARSRERMIPVSAQEGS